MIELLGDCTRTPIFKEVIEKTFQKQELMRTMHSQEFLAKGATVKAAIQNNLIDLGQFHLIGGQNIIDNDLFSGNIERDSE